MAKFCLKDSDEYYLALSEQPKRFDADSPVTNVFFDDTNGQVNNLTFIRFPCFYLNVTFVIKTLVYPCEYISIWK